MKTVKILDVDINEDDPDVLEKLEKALLTKASASLAELLSSSAEGVRLDAIREVIDLYGKSKTRMRETGGGGAPPALINFNLGYLPTAAKGLQDVLLRSAGDAQVVSIEQEKR